jgi:peptidoglycan/LPS O-acetylase OafA/YrhL
MAGMESQSELAASSVPSTIAGAPTRAPSIGSARNFHLDAMRGLSALMVVFDHMRNAFFIPYRKAGSGLLVNIIYIDHYVAGAAVVFFFALSGYLVGTSVLRSNERGTWSWKKYLITRLTRLYVVLIPALLLAALFGAIGRSNPISAPTYFAVTDGYSLAPLDTVSSFFGTLFFLQNIRTAVFGTLGPAWSLANEFWYYMIFPLGVLAFARRRSSIAYGLLCIAILFFVGGEIISLFPTWLAGVAAGIIAQRWPLRLPMRRRAVFAASVVVTLGGIVAAAAHRIPYKGEVYIVGIAAIGLIWSTLSAPPATGRYAKAAILLSEISYTLYLTHQPMLILLGAFWLRGNLWTPDLPHLVLTLVPISIAVFFAYLMYLLFESRTDAVREFVKKAFNFSPSPASPVS